MDKEWKEPHPHRRCLSQISWQSGAKGDLRFCSGTRGGKRAGHLVRGYSDTGEISSEGLLGFSRRSLRDQGEISSEVGRGLLGDLRGRLLVLWARVSLPAWSARVCAGVTNANQSLLVLNPSRPKRSILNIIKCVSLFTFYRFQCHKMCSADASHILWLEIGKK